MYYCGNNLKSHRLLRNGGSEHLGTHNSCFKKGFYRGLRKKVENVSKFLAEWNGAYEPYVQQKLWYGDSQPPSGYQTATLHQSMQRGYAVGCLERAKQLMKHDSRSWFPTKEKDPLWSQNSGR